MYNWGRTIFENKNPMELLLKENPCPYVYNRPLFMGGGN